jgi:hypothetical protein
MKVYCVRDAPALAVLVWGSLAAIALACQVPVFRYALERWESDHYTLAVVAGAEGLTGEQEAVVQSLREAIEGGDFPVNARVRVVEAEKEGAAEAAEKTARLELYYPEQLRGHLSDEPVWSGPVTAESAARVLRSPVRTELVKRLLAGESSVWLLVESGDKEADDAAAATLEGLLGEAGDTLEIPEGVIGANEIEAGRVLTQAEEENVVQSGVPLKIGFSLLRVSRDDPEEGALLGMLLKVEDDLGDFADKPMVFPAFGRGRVLEPLIGAGLTQNNVMYAASYLCGACSCQVKDQNPGVDLLVAADWNAAVAGSEVIMERVLPPLEGFSGLQASVVGEEGGEESAEPAEETVEAEVPGDAGLSPLAVLGMVILVVVVGIGIVTLKMKRNAA